MTGRSLSLFLAGTAIAATAFPALAQTESEQELVADSQSLDTPEEEEAIIVTARRRSERLVDVPLAITSLGGEQLGEQGVLELTEVADFSPNVTLEVSRGTNSTLTAFIRGVGQQDPVAGFEAGVGIYIDDVYLNRPQAAVLDIYDVERIEVLRGPQGTLYGRNTIGGAVKYVTRRLPDFPEIRIRGTVGNYDQADLVISASAPISDGLRIGASGARLSRGGFGDNLVQDGVENYNKDLWAGRVSIEAEPSEVLFLKLSGDYTKDNSDPRQGHRFLPSPSGNFPVLDDVFDTRAGLDVTEQEVEAYGGALHAELMLSDTLELRSITAYREDSSTTPIDFDSLPVPDFDVPAIYENDQLSQELQLLYEGDKLAGLLGFYYLDANALTAFDVLLAQLGDLIGLPGLNAQTFGDVDTETWSVFGDFTYDLTDQWSVSLGGRYTWDKRKSRILRTTFIGGFSDLFDGPGTPIAVTSDFEGSETFEEFTPRASVSFKPTPDHNLYFTFSQGFKGGGFDPRGQTTATPDFDGDGTVSDDEIFQFLRFAPETVESYELGWKGSVLDGALTFGLSGFLGDYTDVQIPGSVGFDSDGDGINDSFAGITTNAGKAHVNGFELEGRARVGRDMFVEGSRLGLTFAFGYIDAEYEEFIDQFGNDVADQAVFQNTPEFTVFTSLDYAVPVAGGELSFIPALSFRSDTSQFEFRNRFLDQDAYALVDASLVWRSDDDRFSLGVHGKNLFDKRYIVAGYDFETIANPLGLEDVVTGFFGDPRRVYVTGEIRF